MQDSSSETVILVSQKFGVSQIDSMRNTVVSLLLCIFLNISSVIYFLSFALSVAIIYNILFF